MPARPPPRRCPARRLSRGTGGGCIRPAPPVACAAPTRCRPRPRRAGALLGLAAPRGRDRLRRRGRLAGRRRTRRSGTRSPRPGIRAADAIGLPVTAWAAGRWPASYRMAVYRPGRARLDTAGPQAEFVERTPAPRRYLRGVTLAGGSFGTGDGQPRLQQPQPRPVRPRLHLRGPRASTPTSQTAASGSSGSRSAGNACRPGRSAPLVGAEVTRVRAALGHASAAGLRVVLDLHGYGDYALGGARRLTRPPARLGGPAGDRPRRPLAPPRRRAADLPASSATACSTSRRGSPRRPRAAPSLGTRLAAGRRRDPRHRRPAASAGLRLRPMGPPSGASCTRTPGSATPAAGSPTRRTPTSTRTAAAGTGPATPTSSPDAPAPTPLCQPLTPMTGGPMVNPRALLACAAVVVVS